MFGDIITFVCSSVELVHKMRRLYVCSSVELVHKMRRLYVCRFLRWCWN